MEATPQMLFALQRFQIMALYTNSSSEQSVSGAYAFAWYAGVYPILNKTAPWHGQYEACFDVREDAMHELHAYLAGRFEKKQPMSFFELEDHYGIRGSRRPGPVWDQDKLAAVCRYFYLCGEFDNEFWVAMLSGDQFPPAAEQVMRKFETSACYFE